MIKVAITDDHQMFGQGLSSLIEQDENMHVVWVSSNTDEIPELQKKDPGDVLLLDINMPGKTGIEACPEIKAEFPDLKIILLTMHDSSAIIQKGLKAGADGYLLKNTGREELLTAIKAISQGDSYFSPRVSQIVMQGLQKKKTQENNTMFVELTDRETDVLKLIAQEYTSTEIGEKLFISPRTVETHRTNLISKLNVRNVAGLVKYALEQGLVD